MIFGSRLLVRSHPIKSIILSICFSFVQSFFSPLLLLFPYYVKRIESLNNSLVSIGIIINFFFYKYIFHTRLDSIYFVKQRSRWKILITFTRYTTYIYISIIVSYTFKLICQYFLFTLKIYGTLIKKKKKKKKGGKRNEGENTRNNLVTRNCTPKRSMPDRWSREINQRVKCCKLKNK